MRNLFHLLKRRRRAEVDFAEEIASHLALESDRLVAEGRTPEEAAFEARRRFGNVTEQQEAFHAGRTIRWIETLPRQLGRAARRLRRAPTFSVTVVVTLMLGIGATTAVFSLVDGILLSPLPFVRPSQLMDLTHVMDIQGLGQVDQSDATFLYYRASSRSFSGIGAYRPIAVNLDGGAGAHAERVDAARASASLFRVLGVVPLWGRTFRDEEDRPGGAPVMLLSERFWRDAYGSDPGIIGRSIDVDGVPHEVVGVLPRRFDFPDPGTDLWLPIGIDPSATRSAAFDFRAVARLREGVTPAAAAAELQRLLPRVPEAFPGRLTAAAIALTHMRAVVRPLRDVVVGEVGRALWVVLGAAGFLLLIACANVGNLFLVRAEERQHDLAVRRALGAGRGEIVLEFLSEGILLAAIGGALGLALASGCLGALRSLDAAVAIPRIGSAGIDGRVLGAAAGMTLLTALVMCVVPALRASGAGVAAVLVRTGRNATAGRGRHRARRAFVVAQMALALVLVAAAGLMVRSFRALRSVPSGFEAEGAYEFRIALPEGVYPTTTAATGLVLRGLAALSTLPGVQAVGALSKVPLDDEARRDTAVFVGDRPAPMGAMPIVHQVAYATPGAFAALGIPLLEGHTFGPPDPAGAPLDVIVTRALARRYWRDSSAVGRRLRLSPDGPAFTIIGVTGDIRGTGLDQPPDETVYLPLVTAPGPAAADGGAGATRWIPRQLAFVARSTAPAKDVIADVEATLGALAPTIPVYGARSMAAVVRRSTARTSFTLELLEIASLVSLLIGAVGLYGVVSYMVSLRSREMAVRIALGARPAALRRLVLTQAAAVAGSGIVLGLGAALLLTRSLAALLFDVTPTDPVTLLAAAAVMSVVAIVASWGPARRASRIDPAAVLRADV